jgi:hypothetical protein
MVLAFRVRRGGVAAADGLAARGTGPVAQGSAVYRSNGVRVHRGGAVT